MGGWVDYKMNYVQMDLCGWIALDFVHTDSAIDG
jgi:hypothetical protein